MHENIKEKIIVQKGTQDEWQINGILEGNINSDNLVIMLHSGGYDKDENGFYPVLEEGIPKRENSKIVLVQKPYGNYQRLSGELQADEVNTAIFRFDIRNHGESKYNGKIDTRDAQFERYARDLSSVILYLKEKYDYKNIHLVGTCLGSLIIQYYISGIGKNKHYSFEERYDVKSLTLISPLSPIAIATNNPKHGFNYEKAQSIRTGKISQFTKMKGVYEGRKTIKEAEENLDIAIKVAEIQIPTLYLVSLTDRLIPADISLKIINDMQKNNPYFRSQILQKKEIRGAADHCFYDPQSSDACLTIVTKYLENQINIEKKQRI